MKRLIHDLQQGSPEWHAFRANHFGASEAAAMLGLSSHKTRQALLREKATGAEEDISDAKQRIFDNGHATEALARPIIEQMICDDLYPATYSYGKLSVSCDGLTMDGETAFEHKQYNAELFASVKRGELPDEHQPQCQQAMHVTGASRLIFVCSDGTPENMASMEVHPDPEWVKRIEAGWAQFAEDLANYQHVEVAAAPVAAPVESLPVLDIQISGAIVASNFSQWREIVGNRIAAIKTDLQDDQDFADAAEMVKFLGDGEKRIDLVKSQAQAQASDIDAVFRALDDIKKLMASKRLELDKLVTRRKDSIKVEIMQEGKTKLAEHIATLNKRIGEVMMPAVPADFVTATKNKRTIQSLRDSVDAELTRAKLAANEAADRITINLNQYAEIAAGYEFLFSDLPALVNQPAAAFQAIVENRINKHAEEERKRMEAERERIAAQERAKIELEQAAVRREAEEAERAMQARAAEAAAAKIEAERKEETAAREEKNREWREAPKTAPQEPLGDSRGTATPAVAAHTGISGSGRLLDRLDELAARMTERELSDLCIHAEHMLANRRAAA